MRVSAGQGSRRLLGVCLLATLLATSGREVQGQQRVETDVLAWYDFRTLADGGFAERTASEDKRLLRVSDADAIGQSAGEVTLLKPTLLRTSGPADELTASVGRSRSLTIEVWLRTDQLKQSGPARIVTLSRNPNERNFTLGQDGDKFEVRLRTTKTSTNGMPALASKPKSLGRDWTHVVYTFDRAGRARLYVNGSLNAEQAIGGDLSNWDSSFALGIGNELSNDRPWLGALRLVCIYGRDLSASEVERNFRAGTNAAPVSPEELLAARQRDNSRLFETRVAPLISKHCLECHDTLTREGTLDLSRDVTAQALDGQRLIAPGSPADSLLWQVVAADQMPHDRPPLAAEEKQWLRQWIEGGGVWSLKLIDPAVYVHGEGSPGLFVQRLTVPEYIATVRSTLGVDISREARELLPRDARADGFSNTAYNLNVDLGHVEAYARLAELIAERMDTAALIKKYTRSRELTDENMTKIITPVGRRLLRGPVRQEEIALYCGVSTSVAGAGGNIEEAVRFVVQAMLQAPRFLYRMEHHPADGPPRLADPFELASRLSYILWGGPPDDELLDAAEKGLLDRAAVSSHARRMLSDPRAVERSRQFIADWLNLGRLVNLRPDPARFPGWDARLAEDMRQETLAYFEEVVWKQNRPLSDLLNAQVTFVTPRLARHYGLQVDPSAPPDQLIRVELPDDSPRGGLLTQGSVLTVGGDEASMVTRGLFVMNELLRGVVRDPPPGTDTTPTPSKPGLTQRLVSERRIANESCVGCHAKFEPLAFGLERFDGLGAYHLADEHGNPLRDDGQVLFPGHERPVEYRSSRELVNLLAASDRVRETLTWKLVQFSLGRPLGPADAPLVGKVHQAAQEAGGTYASLMTALVASDLVMMTRSEKGQ